MLAFASKYYQNMNPVDYSLKKHKHYLLTPVSARTIERSLFKKEDRMQIQNFAIVKTLQINYLIFAMKNVAKIRESTFVSCKVFFHNKSLKYKKIPFN